mmetsp:Transcript_101393/g.286020  ORF Transcript_101393/g.286020 Transcript_101393/m.286020 type:complete len:158 (-) Transcript_101393:141-614(-)
MTQTRGSGRASWPRRSRVRCDVAAIIVGALALSWIPGHSVAVTAPRADGCGYALRVCSKCLKRTDFDPTPTLQQMSREAGAAGWPELEIQKGGCVGACEHPPNVRIVRGTSSVPVTVDGMTDFELVSKSFVKVASDSQATRAFGLAARHIMDHGSEP